MGTYDPQKESSRLPCGHCGDGRNAGTGMIYDSKNVRMIICPVCDGSGWIYINVR